MRASTLARILAPKYMTGGDGTDLPTNSKTPGVVKYTSAFAKADSRDVLSVARMTRKCSVVISPFMMEDIAAAPKMQRYAVRCAQDSLNKGEAPVMSHAFYYSAMNYTNPIERDIGLHSQLTWIHKADVVAFYVDYGVTVAMQIAIDLAESKQRKIEYRSIGAVA